MIDIDFKKLARDLDKLASDLEKEHQWIMVTTERELEDTGRDVAIASRALVPVDTGALRRTITDRRVSDGHIEVTAGGGKVNYAIPVHERLDVRHPTGTAKFLEKPALAATRQMTKKIERKLNGPSILAPDTGLRPID